MKHSRKAGILRVDELTRELFRQVNARNRFSDNLIIFRVLGGNFRRYFHVPADSGGGDFYIEAFAAEEISVSDLLGGVADHTDNAISNGKLVHRRIEARGRKFEQLLPRRRGCLPELHATPLDGS